MRFHCPTETDKLLAKAVKNAKKCLAARKWRPVFAWRRVRVGKRDCRWLEIVWRSFPKANLEVFYDDHFGHRIYYYSKNELEDIIKNPQLMFKEYSLITCPRFGDAEYRANKSWF